MCRLAGAPLNLSNVPVLKAKVEGIIYLAAFITSAGSAASQLLTGNPRLFRSCGNGTVARAQGCGPLSGGTGESTGATEARAGHGWDAVTEMLPKFVGGVRKGPERRECYLGKIRGCRLDAP